MRFDDLGTIRDVPVAGYSLAWLPCWLIRDDEAAVGLGPEGQRPIALDQHRFEWRSVTAFVAPASGETVWSLSRGETHILSGPQMRLGA